MYGKFTLKNLWRKVIYALVWRRDAITGVFCTYFAFLCVQGERCAGTGETHTSTSRIIYHPRQSFPVSLASESRHDHCGNPGRDETLFAARKKYHRPAPHNDVETYVAQCVVCAQHKGTAQDLESPRETESVNASWNNLDPPQPSTARTKPIAIS